MRATLAASVLALAAAGCGSGSSATSSKPSAQSAKVVTQAETMVHDKVQGVFDRNLARYSAEDEMVADGDATCTPVGDELLDCKQPIRDSTIPWKGTSTWRVTLDRTTGDLSLDERGPETLRRVLNRRSQCAAGGINCD